MGKKKSRPEERKARLLCSYIPALSQKVRSCEAFSLAGHRRTSSLIAATGRRDSQISHSKLISNCSIKAFCPAKATPTAQFDRYRTMKDREHNLPIAS